MRGRSGNLFSELKVFVLLGAVCAEAFGQVDHFTFVVAPSAGAYPVEQIMQFRLEARNAAEQVVTSYNSFVTLGLYDPSSGVTLLDPAALIGKTPLDATASTGTARLAFSSGVLNFDVLPRTVVQEVRVWAYAEDGTPPQSAPAPPGTAVDPTTVYQITGYRTPLYPIDATGDSTLYVYPPNNDLLTKTAPVGATVTAQIPFSSDGSQAAVFVYQGLSGGFAGTDLLRPFTTRFYVRDINAGTNSFTNYKIIMDWNGNLTAANYLNPNLAEDTVYELNNIDPGNSFQALPDAGFTGGIPSAPDSVSNLQVIVAFWRQSSANPSEIRLNAPVESDTSAIFVDYSPLNTRQVEGTLSPNVTLAGGGPLSIVMEITNKTASSVGRTRFAVPKNTVAGNTWAFFGASPVTAVGPNGAGVVTSFADPVGTTSDGHVDIDWTSAPVPAGASATVTLSMNVSDEEALWTFGFTNVEDTAAVTLAFKNDGVTIKTLGPPPAPTTLTATPSDLGGNGDISLAWDQVTAKEANGYVLYLSQNGGPFNALVTIGSNAILNYTHDNAPKLTPLVYRIKAKNAVAESVTGKDSAAVTAFVNPAAPASLNALSAGATVQLSWSASVSQPGSFAVTGYQIYRSATSGGQAPPPLATVGWWQTAYTDAAVTDGTQYYYRIRAIDDQHLDSMPVGEHESLFSPEAVGWPPGNPPTGLSGVLSNPATIALNWSAPVNNVNAPVSYLIYRKIAADPAAPADFYAAAPAASTAFNDTGIAPGNFYHYKVAALDSTGVTTNLSFPVTVGVTPSAPTGFSAAAGAASIVLSWNALTGQNVLDYVVYRNGAAAATVVGETNTNWTDTALIRGVNYSYEVSARNSAGEGPKSAPVSSALLPGVPSGLSAVSGEGQAVTLSWSDLRAQEANVTGYNLYRDTDAGFAGAALVVGGLNAAVPTLNYTDTAPGAAGTEVYYFLTAQNIGGEGSPTAAVSLRVPPNAPAGLTAASSNTAVTLTWNANTPAEQVVRYHVYRSTSPSAKATGARIGTVAAPAVTFTDTTAQAGMDYFYAVTADNDAAGAPPGGESAASSDVAAGLLPQQPAGLAAQVETGTFNDVRLNWTNVTTVDANATAVTLFGEAGRLAAPVSPFSLGFAPNTTTALDTGKLFDTYYTYWLKTYNPYGESVYSTPATVLTKPATVQLTSASLLPGGASVELSWTPSAPSANVTNFKVYRQVNGGAFQLVATLGAVTSPVTLSLPMLPGRSYGFRLSAVNSSGEGGVSNTLNVNVPPSAPSGLSASSGASDVVLQVNLSWSANASGENVTSYTVYRATDNTSTASYAPVGSVSAPATVFSDTSGLADGMLYYYLVSANAANGLESALNTQNARAVTAYRLPAPPAGLSAQEGNAQVSLSWSAPSATTYPVSGYNVYVSTSAASQGTKNNASLVMGTTYTVTGLTNGTTYYFQVKTVDAQGNEGPSAGPVFATPVAPPSAPSNLAVDSGNQEIQLFWDASSPGTLPLSGYIVWRANPPGASAVSIAWVPNGVLSYSDNNGGAGLPGGSYEYFLQATDASGNTLSPHVSSLSAPVMGILPVSVFLNPPSNVAARGGDASVTLTWTDAFDPALIVTGYTLFRSTAQAGPYNNLGAAIPKGTTNYTDTGLTNGQTYYYYLRSVDGLNNTSSASATVFAVASSPPPAPTGLTGTDADASVTLTWNTATPSGAPVTGYVVKRNATAAATVAAPATLFSDTGLSNGTPVTYQVAAVNANGQQGADSAPVTAYPFRLTAPQNLAASLPGGNIIRLTWSAPATASYPITGYAVYRRTVGTTYGAPLAVVTGTLFDDTSPQPETNYFYVVRALDDKGHGGALSGEVLENLATPPTPPTGFVAYAGDGQILLDWVESQAGTLPISFYVIYRATTSGGAFSSGVTVGRTPVSQSWFLDTGVSNGTTYYYEVRAVDTQGELVEGVHMSLAPAGGEQTATPSSSNVNPPTGVGATALDEKTIVLSWSPANDQGRVISSYNIYRSTQQGGPYTLVATVFNTPVSQTTSYTDTTVSANITYYYVVRSFDAAESKESSNSNEASAATPKPLRALPQVKTGQFAFDRNLVRPLKGEDLALTFRLLEPADVSIRIYDISGKLIRELHQRNVPADTLTTIFWDVKDRLGSFAASGIYLIEIKAGSFHDVKKVAVVK